MKVVALFAASAAVASAAHIEPAVHRELREQGIVAKVVLELKAGSALEAFEPEKFSNRVTKIETLKAQLQIETDAKTKPLRALFQTEAAAGASLKTYWIQSTAIVENVTPELLAQLAQTPNVVRIRQEKKAKITPVTVQKFSVQRADVRTILKRYLYGNAMIAAQDVWSDGYIGQGVTVGIIDTGARGTHEILKKKFVGAHGWYDPENKKPEPYDLNGHGTHVTGTVLGSKGVGVAPGAKWMACRGCRTEDCPESDLLDCAQWVVCPTDTEGNNPDCSKAPRIVSNSWGGGQGDTFYKEAVDTWIKAGIVPVFAMGNDGDACQTAESPGDYANVIGVGSSNSTDGLSDFSARGPTVGGKIKPDITAPGDVIPSAYLDSDEDYVLLSGTSMATPHVSGAIALLLSAEPELTIDEIKVRLYTTTAQQGLQASGSTCGGTSDRNWPNNQFGHGRLNVLHAYEGFRPEPTL